MTETSNAGTDLHHYDLHQAIGGAAACRELSEAFYARVKQDPVLRPLFPGKTMTCAIEEFSAFLVQFLGGPPENSQRRWWVSLRESHRRFKIGPRERTAWLRHMASALEEVRIEEPLRTALREFFERSSAYIVNGETTAAPSHEDAIHQEIARRWDAQRQLDEAVAAVRSGDAQRAIALAKDSPRSTFTGLLTVMMASRNHAMVRYVQDRITADPALVKEYYAGRTLLHEASALSDSPLVEFLLRLGADPNAKDGGDHAPLYSLANGSAGSGAASVVRALVDCGAKVNADAGVKRCTALHMAARRGNVEAAEALLECGADIEARDSLGDTPLRRAVNCNKPLVAALLLQRGANPHSKGSKGLTPLSAARSSAMQQLLRAV